MFHMLCCFSILAQISFYDKSISNVPFTSQKSSQNRFPIRYCIFSPNVTFFSPAPVNTLLLLHMSEILMKSCHGAI